MAANELIKKPNLKTEYTEEQLLELIRCQEDPIYFIENYTKVQHVSHGSVLLKLYPFQHALINSFHSHDRVIALTARQMGKALALDTQILTPTGFANLGDLKVGNTIYGADGKPTLITFITETMHHHRCIKVNFAHGDTIIADAEHLWNVRLPTRSGKVVTVNTIEMMELHTRYKKRGQSISIEHCKTIEFKDRSTPVDPYMFGAWLGDGNNHDAQITCHIGDYDYLVRRSIDAGFAPSEFKPDPRRPTTGAFNPNGLHAALSQMGVVKNKHIPAEMLHTSAEKRLELLRGLMDTDGTVEKNGVCRLYQSNKALAEQVRFLLSSLGIKSTLRLNKTRHQERYVLTFATDQMVCSLPRKAERLSALKNHPKNKRIYIESMEETTSVPVRCLQVSNEDHLFLAGTTLVPTHNTTTAGSYLLWRAMFVEDSKILIVANKLKAALEVMTRVKYAYEECPDWLKAGAKKCNEGTLAFDNGSIIEAVATTPDAARGKSLSLLYLDEFAFVPNNMATAFWTAVQPTLSTGGACIITSTPRTDEDQFAQLWKGAQIKTDEYGNDTGKATGVNGFFAISVPWWEHPERDEEWAKPFRSSLGPARFAQEFECVTRDAVIEIENGDERRPMSVGAMYDLLKMAQAA